MKKTALGLMLIIIVSKIFGFARDIILAYFYGASNISDAYLISQTIPVVVFGFVGAGIGAAYIPIYSKIENQDGEIEANNFTNDLVNFLLIFCTIIVILVLIYTDIIIKIIASGFEGETFNIAVQFTRISIIGIYSTGLVFIFKGFLQLKNKHVVTALIGFPMNIIIVISIFLSYDSNVYILVIGGVIGLFSQLVLLVIFSVKNNYKYKFNLRFKNKHMKKMLYVALPVMIGVSVNEINTLVDRTIASQITTGGISALNYATKLNGFVLGIFVLPIASVMFPLISRMVIKKDIEGLRNAVTESINSVILLIVPVTIGAMLFSEPIIQLLYGRGAFTEEAVSLTSNALFFYTLGLIGFGLREVLSRVFYSLEDTKTPMINATIAMIMNVILNIILSKYLGIGGLALATSLSAIFCSFLLFFELKKKDICIDSGNILITLLKVIGCSFLMGILTKKFYEYLSGALTSNINLFITVIFGLVVYLILIYLVKVKEIEVIVLALRKKINRNKI